MKSGIYLIRNTINDKKYVGSTVSTVGFNMRWSKHISELKFKRHGNPHLQSAWNKYGKGCFEFSILEECSDGILVIREQIWMDHYKSMDNSCGYNLREASNKGKLSEETKKKISGSKKGKTLGIDNHFYGKYHTDETKKKISTSRMGKNVGHVGYMTGKHHTDDFKKNVSEKMKNNEHALGFQQFNVNL